jgi:hypothetical protein
MTLTPVLNTRVRTPTILAAGRCNTNGDDPEKPRSLEVRSCFCVRGHEWSPTDWQGDRSGSAESFNPHAKGSPALGRGGRGPCAGKAKVAVLWLLERFCGGWSGFLLEQMLVCAENLVRLIW